MAAKPLEHLRQTEDEADAGQVAAGADEPSVDCKSGRGLLLPSWVNAIFSP